MEKVIRCRNVKVHPRGTGHILMVYDNDYIYVRCSERSCRRWARIKISFPGINMNFENAAIEQELMPVNHRFKIDSTINDISPASVIYKE